MSYEEIFKGMQIIFKYESEKIKCEIIPGHDEIHIGFEDCLEIVSENDKKKMFLFGWDIDEDTIGFSHIT